jgi:hypothetical protein
MARVARQHAAAAGVYGWLLEREENEFRAWVGSVHAAAGARYPRQPRLDRLRSGEPVTVTVAELPGRFRPSWAPQPAASQRDAIAAGDEYLRASQAAAVVHADDRVVRPSEPGDLFDDLMEL